MKQLLNQSQDNLYIIGSNHIGSLIPVYAAKSGQFRKYEGVFVIAEDGLDILPEGLYLSYSYRGNNNHNAVAIPRLLSYATEKGYRIGVRLTPSFFARRTSISRSPGFSSPRKIA